MAASTVSTLSSIVWLIYVLWYLFCLRWHTPSESFYPEGVIFSKAECFCSRRQTMYQFLQQILSQSVFKAAQWWWWTTPTYQYGHWETTSVFASAPLTQMPWWCTPVARRETTSLSSWCRTKWSSTSTLVSWWRLSGNDCLYTSAVQMLKYVIGGHQKVLLLFWFQPPHLD